MDLARFAAEIARNVGREFPDPLAPWQEMTLRQLSSMVEEAIELDEALERGVGIAGELSDAIITPYLVAHYASIDLTATIAGPVPRPLVTEMPYRLAGVAMKAGRRYLDIARRSGTREELATALARVVLSVQGLARQCGIDLDQALADKLNVIFSRGWREVPADVSHSRLGSGTCDVTSTCRSIQRGNTEG